MQQKLLFPLLTWVSQVLRMQVLSNMRQNVQNWGWLREALEDTWGTGSQFFYWTKTNIKSKRDEERTIRFDDRSNRDGERTRTGGRSYRDEERTRTDVRPSRGEERTTTNNTSYRDAAAVWWGNLPWPLRNSKNRVKNAPQTGRNFEQEEILGSCLEFIKKLKNKDSSVMWYVLYRYSNFRSEYNTTGFLQVFWRK